MGVEYLGDGLPKNRRAYEWKSGSATVAGATAATDITGITAFEDLFSVVKNAHYVKIESTATLYVRLNSATNDIITVTATSPFESEDMFVNHIYVSTGGAAVTVTVRLH